MKEIASILVNLGLNQWALIVIVLSIFIDITPAIKFNPIKAIFSFMGKWFNSSVQKEIGEFKIEVNNKFDKLQQEQIAQRETLNKIRSDQEAKEISYISWSITDFHNSLINGEKHNREEYRHIFDSYKKYNRIITDSETLHVDTENDIKLKEYMGDITAHYDQRKNDQTVLYF